MARLYYIAPSDKLFDEMKFRAISIWRKCNNEGGYVDDKLKRIDIENVSDNFMYILAMFDKTNQRTLLSQASKELRVAVRERMVSGGAREEEMVMMGL